MKRILVYVLGVSVAVAGDLNSIATAFHASLKTDACRERVSQLDEFKLLFATDEFADAFSKSDAALLHPSLAKWSTDLILKVALEIDQDVFAICEPTPFLSSLEQNLKQLYLERLGAGHVKVSDRPKLFRALVMHKEEREPAKKKLGQSKKVNLETLFGTAKEYRGVWILGGGEAVTPALESLLTSVCEDSHCPFWDEKVLYRVLVTDETGVAGYVPELATLAVSSSLFEKPNLLSSVVLLHELTHVAERSVWVSQRRDWAREFQVFSDWHRNDKKRLRATVKKLEKKTRQDKLTELSKESPFSLLPDAVYLGTGWFGVKPDGFVTEKAYTETIRQDTVSEDLADHVAIYRLFPERYCFEGKEVAPRKFQWIGDTIFSSKRSKAICR